MRGRKKGQLCILEMLTDIQILLKKNDSGHAILSSAIGDYHEMDLRLDFTPKKGNTRYYALCY